MSCFVDIRGRHALFLIEMEEKWMGKQRDGVGLGEEGGRGNLARMQNKLIDFF